MLKYKTETRLGLVALYDIRLGNGVGQFLQPHWPHGASGGKESRFEEARKNPDWKKHEIRPGVTSRMQKKKPFGCCIIDCSCCCCCVVIDRLDKRLGEQSFSVSDFTHQPLRLNPGSVKPHLAST